MNNFNRLYERYKEPQAFKGIINTLPNTANQLSGTHLGVDHVTEYEDVYTTQRTYRNFLGPRKNRHLTKAR